MLNLNAEEAGAGVVVVDEGSAANLAGVDMFDEGLSPFPLDAADARGGVGLFMVKEEKSNFGGPVGGAAAAKVDDDEEEDVAAGAAEPANPAKLNLPND